MNVRDRQKAVRIGRFEVYCLKTGTVEWNWYETTNFGLRDWSSVPNETTAKVKAHVGTNRLAWIWEIEIDGWEFQGQDREEKRIMDAIRDEYDLLAPLSPERRNKLCLHGIRSLIEGIPMPPVWKNLQERRAEPEAIRARIAGLESRLEAVRVGEIRRAVPSLREN